MKRAKIAVVLMMVSAMLFGTVSAFADDRDIWDAGTMTKFATKREFAQDKMIRRQVAQNEANFYFEVGGKLYKMADANKLFAQDPANFMTKFSTVTPAADVPGGEHLEIIAIE